MSKKLKSLSTIDLQKLLNESDTLKQVLTNVGVPVHSTNYECLKKLIGENGLCLNNLDVNRAKYIKSQPKSKIDLDLILVENSKYNNTSNLKARLVKEGILNYSCAICNNLGEWNGAKLSLQLDHINGINNDNRIDNLRILCPNCHSQTDNYAGKNIKVKPNLKCVDCGLDILRQSKRCVKCSNRYKNQTIKFHIDRNTLQDLVNKYSMIKISKIYGVSDITIRNRCKEYGITKKAKQET